MIEIAKSIHGWMSEKELQWLAETAKKCNTIVEFGCFHGRSTRALADNCPGVVHAVDPWNGHYYKDNGEFIGLFQRSDYDVFCNNLRDHIESGKVIVHKDYSYAFPPRIKADLVFIDGDHRYNAVLIDIQTADSILNKGGIIAGHDFTHADWPGVARAVKTMFGGDFNLVDSIWWTKL